MEYLKTDDTVKITTMFGVDARQETATVKSYLGNYQYTVETESGNRYIRYLDSNGNETGVDKIKALLMSATDADLLECQEFIKSQLSILH